MSSLYQNLQTFSDNGDIFIRMEDSQEEQQQKIDQKKKKKKERLLNVVINL